ncbi:MAG: septum formation initiator family protein [Acidimicrobiia bacterium]|nr:septum formation initiator family protein [Acidimicrobiia bacterium]
MAGRSTGGAGGGRSRSTGGSRRSAEGGAQRSATAPEGRLATHPRRARLTPPRPGERPTLSPSPAVAALSVPDRRFELVRELGPVAVVLALAVVVLAGLAVLPARTWWTQRQSLNQSRAELAQVEQDVADLKARQELLQTDAEVERIARQDYDLVYPGEESYRLVPAEAVPASGAGADPAAGTP